MGTLANSEDLGKISYGGTLLVEIKIKAVFSEENYVPTTVNRVGKNAYLNSNQLIIVSH